MMFLGARDTQRPGEVENLMPQERSKPLDELARAIGLTGDARDEHWRWQVYETALHDHGTLAGLLMEAARSEPDSHLVVGLALRMVEHEPIDRAEAWIDLVPAFEQPKVRQRARDAELVRQVAAGQAAPTATEVDSWSDWLQRRLAHAASSPGVLDALERYGRTRRVRGEPGSAWCVPGVMTWLGLFVRSTTTPAFWQGHRQAHGGWIEAAWLRSVSDCGCPDVYYCPASDGVECPRHGGFGTCCDRTDNHIAVPVTLRVRHPLPPMSDTGPGRLVTRCARRAQACVSAGAQPV